MILCGPVSPSGLVLIHLLSDWDDGVLEMFDGVLEMFDGVLEILSF